jgi:hypothetical protein
MQVNISYLEVPLEFQGVNGKELNLEKWNNSKLSKNMFLTAEPLYKNINIEFSKLIDIVKSDYRQYSPFTFKDGIKKSENWSNEYQDLIILDIDNGLTIQEAKKQFKSYEYLLATTKSHQIDKKGLKCDRFRIIIPSNNIPKDDEYFNFMRMIEKKYPFIDKQVNTKTGAFLGFFGAEYFYNKGNFFNCNEVIETFKRLERAKMVDKPQQKTIFKAPISHNINIRNDLPIQDIKNRLTRELVADIVSASGYEVNRKFMFKYRHNEKTPSASISPDLLIKDFGSDLSTDVIGFVQEANNVDFKTAVSIVAGYVGITI